MRATSPAESVCQAKDPLKSNEFAPLQIDNSRSWRGGDDGPERAPSAGHANGVPLARRTWLAGCTVPSVSVAVCPAQTQIIIIIILRWPHSQSRASSSPHERAQRASGREEAETISSPRELLVSDGPTARGRKWPVVVCSRLLWLCRRSGGAAGTLGTSLISRAVARKLVVVVVIEQLSVRLADLQRPRLLDGSAAKSREVSRSEAANELVSPVARRDGAGDGF